MPIRSFNLHRSADLLLAKCLERLVKHGVDVLGDQLAFHAGVLHLVGVHEENRLAVDLLDLRAPCIHFQCLWFWRVQRFFHLHIFHFQGSGSIVSGKFLQRQKNLPKGLVQTLLWSKR